MNGHRTFGKGLIHDSPIYLAMHEIGVEHFRILLIQNAPCNSKEELHAIEYEVAQQFHQRGVILYNVIIDGRHTDETRSKMRKARGKRGCITHDNIQNRWCFIWKDNGKRNVKIFSGKKYGYDGAHGLALFHQEEMYPLERDDDSEFIQEIKNRLNN